MHEDYAYQIVQWYSTKNITEHDENQWCIYAESHWLRPYRSLTRATEDLNNLPFPGYIQQYTQTPDKTKRTWLTAGIAYKKNISDIEMHNYWPARNKAIQQQIQSSPHFHGQPVQLSRIEDGACYIITPDQQIQRVLSHQLLLGQYLKWIVEDNEPIFTLKPGMEIWWSTPNTDQSTPKVYDTHIGIIQSLHNKEKKVPWLPIVFDISPNHTVIVTVIKHAHSYYYSDRRKQDYKIVGETSIKTSEICFLGDPSEKNIT